MISLAIEEGEIGTKSESPGRQMQYTQPNVPPGYPMPPSYFPPPGYHFETKTEKGLKYINWGLWLFVFAQVIGIMTTLLFFSRSIMDERGFLFSIGLSSIMGLIMLVSVLLFLVGFFTMYSGKQEYGPVHFQKVTQAMIFFILSIAISIGLVFLSISFLFWGGFDPDVNGFYSSSPSFVIMYLMFNFFLTLFFSLGWVYLIIELASEDIKRLLWLTFVISLIISLIGVILDLRFGLIGALSDGLGIIVVLLVIHCYWRTYIRIRDREIMPIPPPVMPPPYFPPGYPLQYPPGYPQSPSGKPPI